ncbi:CBY1-interacting BAR domain-containing protein 1 isoform X3 [Halyomorpha halys]|uniref:CBY1-interacting BAR domain-containing protein 1 isoform X3 n=1 Tax=Halyomorpha halys TaxID=286706 RepID=UPI0034D1BD74
MNMSTDFRDRKMNIMRASKLENVAYEELAKFVNDRLVTMENSFAKICSAFSVYIKKMSSLRNATDDLAVLLHEYASEEKINKSMKGHILQFSELLASVGDSRDVEVKQLDSLILKDLCNYETLCQNAKAEVKNILNLKDKEINKHKQLQKLRNRNPYKREDIIRAEASLSDAMSSISRSLKELEEHINQFEQKKIQDMKSFLLKFITIELAQHSNAIQLFTQSFNEIKKIDVSGDSHVYNPVTGLGNFQSSRSCDATIHFPIPSVLLVSLPTTSYHLSFSLALLTFQEWDFEVMMKSSMEEKSQKRTMRLCKHHYSPVLNSSLNNTKSEDTRIQLNKKYLFCRKQNGRIRVWR